MRFTIVPADRLVAVDGVPRRVDALALDPSIHAVQGYGSHIEIEHVPVDGFRPPNTFASDMTPFLAALAAWKAAEPPPPPVPPAPLPEPPSRVVSALDFMERLTFEERLAIRRASKASEALEDWLDLLRAAQQVDLDDPRTVGGLAAIVAAGLLTEARAQEIVA